MPSVQAKARREKLTALAGRRSIFASRVYPRYRAALQAALDAQVRELAKRAREERRPLLPDSLQRRWAKELENAQRSFIPALAAHGWNLAGDEVLAAGKAKSRHGEQMGAKAVEVPGYDDFIQRADWPNLEKWIKTTAESASATTAQRILRVYEDAAAHYDKDKGRGRTPPEIARQLLSEGLVQSEARANMLAHTGSIWAYNEGAVQRYADEGIAVVEWLTAEDELRCPFCASMNGVRIAVKDAFLEAGDTISLGDAGVLKIPKGKFGFDVRHPPLHPNCLVPETPVFAPDQVAAFVAAYDGPIVELRFADGRGLTVTPNHMLLTPSGFARAASLRQGDEVLDGSRAQGIIRNGPNDHGGPAPIREVVEALAKARGVSARSVPLRSEYLHGDAAFVQGQIHVVGTDGLLQSDFEAALSQRLGQCPFHGVGIAQVELIRNGDLGAVLRALALASDGGMSVRRESEAFARRHAPHAQPVGGTLAANAQFQFPQPVDDDGSTYAQNARHREYGFAGGVALRQLAERHLATSRVISVHWRSYRGHVYDLQTESSLYLANGIVSSNCRCTLIPIVDAGQIEVEVRDDQSAPATATGDTLAFLAGSEDHERKQEEWENGLGPEERAAFQVWASPKHHLIQAIEAGIYVDDPEAQRAYLDMQAALKRAPRVEGIFYRGMSLRAEVLEELLSKGELSMEFTQSVSRSRGIARQFSMWPAKDSEQIPLMLIVSTKRAVDIKVLTEVREKEYLLLKGAPIKFRSLARRTLRFGQDTLDGWVITLEDR